MKVCPVSKKLRKYAYTRTSNIRDRVEIAIYSDEVKHIEERLVKAETELAWKNAYDAEAHIIDLQKKLLISENRVKAWQEALKSDCPWEADFKHKAEVAILSYKLEKSNEMVAKMFPSFWKKSGEVGNTKFYMRKH